MTAPAPVAAAAPAATPQTLTGLQELALPDPVPYVPQTPGWIAVAVLFVVLLAYAGWRMARRYRAQRYRRAALREVASIEARLGDASTRGRAVGELAALLKRTALAAAPRDAVASLSGAPWIDFLRATRGRFDDRSAALIVAASYARAEGFASVPRDDVTRLVAQSRDWIGGHHVEI